MGTPDIEGKNAKNDFCNLQATCQKPKCFSGWLENCLNTFRGRRGALFRTNIGAWDHLGAHDGPMESTKSPAEPLRIVFWSNWVAQNAPERLPGRPSEGREWFWSSPSAAGGSLGALRDVLARPRISTNGGYCVGLLQIC